MSKLKLVHDTPPDFVEALEDALKLARSGELMALNLSYVRKDDAIVTEYVKGADAGYGDLLLANEILRDDILKGARKL